MYFVLFINLSPTSSLYGTETKLMNRENTWLLHTLDHLKVLGWYTHKVQNTALAFMEKVEDHYT